MPVRIQRRRIKGWRLPPNTICVSRPSKFGNLFVIGEEVPPNTFWKNGSYFVVENAEMAVDLFRHWQAGTAPNGYTTWRPGPLIINSHLHELRGKNLSCWCRLCDKHAAGKPFGEACPDCAPCHADPLGERANAQEAA